MQRRETVHGAEGTETKAPRASKLEGDDKTTTTAAAAATTTTTPVSLPLREWFISYSSQWLDPGQPV